MMYYIPALALFVCAALYFFENRAGKKKWAYNIGVFALHIFIVAYFMLSELDMEILLVFLLASLALSISVKRYRR